jgi:hypothetical protein
MGHPFNGNGYESSYKGKKNGNKPAPKTVTSSTKRRVLESLTSTSWSFHCPWKVSHLNMYACK